MYTFLSLTQQLSFVRQKESSFALLPLREAKSKRAFTQHKGIHNMSACPHNGDSYRVDRADGDGPSKCTW